MIYYVYLASKGLVDEGIWPIPADINEMVAHDKGGLTTLGNICILVTDRPIDIDKLRLALVADKVELVYSGPLGPGSTLYEGNGVRVELGY